MAGSSRGRNFSLSTFGESHGPAIGCIVDGCPPGMELGAHDIQPDLDRRKPGTSRHVTQRQEADLVEILSGVFEGRTTGTPIALLIRNEDARSKDYAAIAQTFRPGHADYTYWHKYGVRDPRGGGRASARLTAPAVAAGAIARKWLGLHYGVQVRACLVRLGELEVPCEDWEAVDSNPFFAATRDTHTIATMEAVVDSLRREGDSCGAQVRVEALQVPVGWGEPIYDRLDADLAHALMGINAVKGVEIGAGFASVRQRGSEHGDALTPGGFASNHAGGILGGISTGQTIVASVAIKPTSSIRTAKASIDLAGDPTEVRTGGRHDPCVGIRAVPVAEAMLLLVLMDHALRHRAQCADVQVSTPRIAALAPPADPARASEWHNQSPDSP